MLVGRKSRDEKSSQFSMPSRCFERGLRARCLGLGRLIETERGSAEALGLLLGNQELAGQRHILHRRSTEFSRLDVYLFHGQGVQLSAIRAALQLHLQMAGLFLSGSELT